MPDDPRQLDSDRLDAETRSLRALARALVGNEHDADDLAQDAWVTALGRPPRSGWSLRSWLGGIVRNHARQRERSERRRAARELAASRGEAQGIEDTVERLDLLRHLLDQAARLDEPYRSTILLRFVDGLPPEEVAHRLGVPHATVRTRLRRGIERLRARMDATVDGGRRAWALPFAAFSITAEEAVAAATAAAATSTLTEATLVLAMKKSAAILVGLAAVGALLILRPWSSDAQTPAPGGAPTSSEQVARSPEPEQRVTNGVPDRGASPATRQEVTPQDPIEARVPSEQATITVRGSVLAAEGGGIAGARVAITASAGKGGAGKGGDWGGEPEDAPTATTTTAADGSFEVTLRHDVDEPVAWIRARARASERVTDTRLVAVGGRLATVELELDRAIIIAGRVVERGGAPIAGARVWTWRETQTPTLTDDQGRFRLDDIDPDIEQHYVHARAAGYIDRGEMTRIADRAAPDEVILVLDRGARVSGTVLAGTAPVEGARLSISRGKSEVEAVSDEEGAFLLDGAPSGPQTLSVRHPGFPPQARELDVPPPGAEAEITVRLEPGRALGGVVHGPRGEPVVGARITAHRGKETLRNASSDQDGTFELLGLPAGELSIRCTAEGYVPTRQSLPAGVSYLRLDLDAGASFAGTVLDAITGEPIPKFAVRFLRPGAVAGEWGGKGDALLGGWRPFADPDGHWDTGVEGWPEGFVVDVEVRAEGYATGRSAGLVARVDADPEQHRVALDAGTTLRGAVVTPIGAPLANATVRALRGRRGVAKPWTTDARGIFEFIHVPSGSLRLVVEHPDWGVFTQSVEIPEGAAFWEESVEVQAQATLSGFVRTPGGEAVPEARVRLAAVDVPGMRGRSWTDKSDAAGRFSFDHLPPGGYRLGRVEDRAGSEGKNLELFTIAVTIDGSGPHAVDLVATGTGSVRGSLSAPAPIPELTYIRLEPLEGDDAPGEVQPTPLWTRGHAGVFSFENLESGAYRLVVSFRDPASGTSLQGTQDIEVVDGVETVTTVTLEPVTAGGGGK